MRFAEIELFGVYVAPLSLNLVGAWFATIALRRVAGRLGLLHHAWQRAQPSRLPQLAGIPLKDPPRAV